MIFREELGVFLTGNFILWREIDSCYCNRCLMLDLIIIKVPLWPVPAGCLVS